MPHLLRWRNISLGVTTGRCPRGRASRAVLRQVVVRDAAARDASDRTSGVPSVFP